MIDDSLLEEAKKSSITKKVISNYILSAMQEKDRMSIPVTIKEIDEIMPKDHKDRGENYYLNYAIIQFLKRNRWGLVQKICTKKRKFGTQSYTSEKIWALNAP